MFQHIFFLINLLLLGTAQAESKGTQWIEIYDIQKQRVVMEVEKDIAIQSEVEGILGSINGVVQSINPIPEDGIILRIPLGPNLLVENEWIHDLLDEVLIFFPTNDDPYVLIFDQENRGRFFTYHYDSFRLYIKVMMRQIG